MTRLARHLESLVLVFMVGACAGAPAASTLSSAGPVSPTASESPAGSASAPATAAASVAKAVVLRVATVEPEDSPEGKAIAYFGDQVKDRSSGTVTILPSFADGENDQGNIQRVTTGGLDLAIVQARNWDEFGVTSMQALQTPFLVDSDAAAAAATSGALADTLMAGLAAKGVRGLALWPIDLRHPVAFGKPLLSPADFKGLKIRIVGSTITRDVIKALGAEPVGEYDDTVRGGESAYDRAYSLPEPGTFTGNVTFYPRVDVFFASQAVLDGLAPSQRDAVVAAAAATRDHVVDGIVPDAQQATGYCTDAGGSVALASDAQLAAFGSALAPIEDAIGEDPMSKDLIAQIRTLTEALPAPEPTVACGKP